MGRDYYNTRDGTTQPFENPYKTDTSERPTLPCLFCTWLFVLVWPVPFFTLAFFVFGPSADLGTSAGWIDLIVFVFGLLVICLIPGVFIGARLLKKVCSEKKRAAMEARGLSRFQRALDWWLKRHPIVLFVLFLILSGRIEDRFFDSGDYDFSGWLESDFLEPTILWSFVCLSWLLAGLCICAISSLFIKAPSD